MNITLVQRPPSVSAERIACLVIPLNRDPDLEPSSLEPKIETTGTGIEANDSWRWHGGTLRKLQRGVKTCYPGLVLRIQDQVGLISELAA